MAVNLLLVGVFVIIMLMMSAKQFKKKKKILFFGDSITEMAVNPGGYISLLREWLKAEGSDERIELIGSGKNGDKVYDLLLRMDKDVLLKDPHVVFIYIGVNDVWHKLSGAGTDDDKFELFYNAIVEKLLAANIKVILCTPTVIGEKNDQTNEQDNDLDKYAALIRSVASNNDLPLVDLRNIFLKYIFVNNPENKVEGILTYDRVHLNEKGNQVVAAEFWREIQKIM